MTYDSPSEKLSKILMLFTSEKKIKRKENKREKTALVINLNTSYDHFLKYFFKYEYFKPLYTIKFLNLHYDD